MRARILSVFIAAVLVIPAVPASAVIINPGFETGNFTGWSTTGATSVVTGAFGVAPVEGTFQSLLTTGTGAVSVGSLETFLGLGAGALSALVGGTATEGSAIKQTFSVNPGDRIQFAWNFLTNEATPDGTFNDTSFAIISPAFHELADTAFATFIPAPGTGLNEQTGYRVFTSDPLIGGSVTLAFGVVDLEDTAVDSALLVDAVPEPGTLALLGTSLGGLVAACWRRRHQHSA